MKRLTLFSIISLLASCGVPQQRRLDLRPREWQSYQFRETPAWATGRLGQKWWQTYQSHHLSQRVETALRNNPSLAVASARLAEADAKVRRAQALGYPQLDLSLGLRQGRFRELGEKVRPFSPWYGGSTLAWEIDLSGKLNAARRSAESERQARFWDRRALELEVASRVALAHFRLDRLERESRLTERSLKWERHVLDNFKRRHAAGFASDREVLQQQSKISKVDQDLVELRRVQGLAALELQTLMGTTQRVRATGRMLPEPKVESRSLTQLLQSHPSLLAAESRVRAAYQTEESARLNLLPSLSLSGGLSGGSNSLTNRFKTWEAVAGPRLDLPIFDPGRRASAQVARARTETAAASYRQALFTVVREVESALLDLEYKGRLLKHLNEEKQRMHELKTIEERKLRAGLVSEREVWDATLSLITAERAELVARHARLMSSIHLMRALGR